MAKRSIPDPRAGLKQDGMYVKVQPKKPLGPFKLSTFLFDKQFRFVEDPRPFKIAVCSRRSGKTVACAAHLIDTALKSEEILCLYITLSRNNAKKLVWREIKKINDAYCLGGVEDLTELSMTFPNGSIIYLSGAKDASEIEKFRGLAIKLAYVDECQSFREYIRDLIDDIISPALIDYAGTLCLIGTPGPIPAGYFAEVAGAVQEMKKAAEAWAHHAWTFFDNPFLEVKSGLTHQQMLDRELLRRGVTKDDPSIQREFFGRWVLDSDSLWIKYKSEKNNYSDLPKSSYNYIMGIDLGYMDADAIAVIAWSEQSNTTYLVDEVIMEKQGLTELVAQIKHLASKYEISKMVIDEGGLGKKLAEEMRRQHQLPVQPADKARKQENVAFLNDALRTGRFRARSSSKFAQDSFLVEIDWDKSTPDRIKISDKYHSDIIDAVLYAFKESPAFAFEAAPTPLRPGTKEWQDAQSNEMWEQAQEHFQEQARLQRAYDGHDD